ncbi:hypothetical protein ACLB2K_073235 [Fragaria x ananassa]
MSNIPLTIVRCSQVSRGGGREGRSKGGRRRRRIFSGQSIWPCSCSHCKPYQSQYHVCRSFLTSSWTKDFANFCDWYAHLLRKSPTGTIHIHVLGNIVTSNPENVEYMFKTRFDNYPKGKPFTVLLGDLLGRGIFNVDGDMWRFQRKMASLELGSVTVRSHALEVVTAEIQSRLIPLMASVTGNDSDAGILDLQDVFRRFSFDNICKFSFGLDPGCLEPSLPISKFADAFDLASKLSAERAMTSSPVFWKIKRFFNVGSEKQLKEAVRIIDDQAKEVIKQRREKGYVAKNDLLSRQRRGRERGGPSQEVGEPIELRNFAIPLAAQSTVVYKRAKYLRYRSDPG